MCLILMYEKTIYLKTMSKIASTVRLSKLQIGAGIIVGLAVGSLIPDNYNLLSIIKNMGKKIPSKAK